jgi:hypothetical protein
LASRPFASHRYFSGYCPVFIIFAYGAAKPLMMLAIKNSNNKYRINSFVSIKKEMYDYYE